jgi:hippurate hydrolase
VYWLLGGADPAAFAGATSQVELLARVAAQPSNHSPFYAPVVEPTLSVGVAALVGAAQRWLPAE